MYSFSEACLAALRTLREQMLDASLPLLTPDSIVHGESLDSVLLDVWGHVQVLSKWLHVQGELCLLCVRYLS